MEITLNASHLLTVAIALVALAMLCYAFMLIKAFLHHLKEIQARTKAAQEQLEKSRKYLDAVHADMEYIHGSLESTPKSPGRCREDDEADIPAHLSEFKRALAMFRRQTLGKSK